MPVASTSAGTSNQAEAFERTATAASVTAIVPPIVPERADAGPSTSDQRPTAIRSTAADPLADGEHGRRLPGREPVLVVEEEDDEAHHRHLGDEVETAPPAGEPEAPVAQGELDVGRVQVLLGAGPEHERPGERACEHEAGDEEQAGARRLEQRQHERGDRAPDRHGRRRTPSAKAALAGSEPAHHRPAAARLDAAAGDAGKPEEEHERLEARRVRGRGEEAGADGKAGGERPALAEAVDREAPGQERERQPDPLGCEDDADLRQAELVLLAQRRREHRDRE